ncbi:MAG: competence protein CoiA family protein [Chromatiaceae bacterium]|jgi:competence CoiA-like predicted nuclease
MPFVAIREDGGGRVYIDEFDNPKVALDGVEFACQDCRSPMVIRSGDFVAPHFAHKPGYEDRPCWFRRAGESEVHLDAKRRIANALKSSPFFAGAHVEIEYPVDTAAGRRYIDVYMELPDGRRYAHEAQISGQSIAAFTERTQAYRSLGFEPVWWLGGSARTSENQAWVKGNCTFLGDLEIRSEPHVLIDERADDYRRSSYGNGTPTGAR